MADSKCKICANGENERCTKGHYADCVGNDYDGFEPKVEPAPIVKNPIRPDYYKAGGVECIDAMVSEFGVVAVSQFCLCNTFKYMWRYADKNGDEDIEKAKYYMGKYKELLVLNNAEKG